MKPENASTREAHTQWEHRAPQGAFDIPMLNLNHHYLARGRLICSTKGNLNIITVNQEAIHPRKRAKCQLFVLAAGEQKWALMGTMDS